MRCFQGRLFTVDGMIEDEVPLKKEIYEQIRYYATTSVARRIEHIVQAIKLTCASEPPEIQTDRIHVRNGTYFVDGHFTPEKEYCMNRLNGVISTVTIVIKYRASFRYVPVTGGK